jgi:hypothetical protein
MHRLYDTRQKDGRQTRASEYRRSTGDERRNGYAIVAKLFNQSGSREEIARYNRTAYRVYLSPASHRSGGRLH